MTTELGGQTRLNRINTASKTETDENSSIDSLQIYISWENLRFEVEDKESKKNKLKTILNGLNGNVKPGELVAVIGPSGSGKSSFLNCIAGRNVDGVSGKILFNGVKRPINFARFTGYVIQDDLYFETLTVLETLRFCARLKLPRSMTKNDREQRIMDIMDELDLHKCGNTRIGKVGAGISGGERRRLAIALEIINEPSLLLLDEPTSGLDSASALLVGNILKRMAQKRKITILATIHQPRYSLATLFDKIYFLGKGNELYFGPSFPDCINYFNDAGYPCPEHENPADFLLDLVNTTDNEQMYNNTKNNEANADIELKNNDELININNDNNNGNNTGKSREEIIEDLANKYKKSEYAKDALRLEIPSDMDGNTVFNEISKDFYITPTTNQIWVIFVRSFVHKLREPIAFMTQAFNAIFLPFVFGSVYWQIDLSQQSAYDRISAIALIVLCQAFFPFDIIMLFPSERQICNREQSSGMYRSISFYIGRTLSEFPQHTIFSIILAVITYFMYGLQNDINKFLKFNLIVVLCTHAGAGLLLLFSALSKTTEQANLLTTLFLLLFMLFDGNWISLDKVPKFWRWIKYISFLGYSSQAAIVSEYRGLTFDCSNIPANECIFQTGNDVLFTRGLQDVDVLSHIYLIIVLIIAFRILAFVAFWLLYRNKKPLTIIKETFCCK